MTKTYPEAIAIFPKAFQLVIKKIHNRVEGGKNCNILIGGMPGTGKSYSGIQLIRGLYLYRHGKEPSVDYVINRIFFKPTDFMKNLNREDLKPGECCEWEEVGTSAGHKDHMSIRNKVIGFTVQTFRNLRQVTLFTVPGMGMIDATIRKLLNFYFETQAIDKKNNMCIVKPLELQYNHRMDKLYFHNLTFPNEDGFIDEIDLIGVPLIPKELAEAYEVRKKAFTTNLNLQIQATLEQIEAKDNRALRGPLEKLTPRQRMIYDLITEGVTSTKEIAEKVGCASSIISQNLNYMRGKGIEIDRFTKKMRVLGGLGQNLQGANLISYPQPEPNDNEKKDNKRTD